MEYKKFSSGVKIPVLGLGTWGMGGEFKTDRSQDEKYIEALRHGIKLGMTHIDTAEVYGAGHTEEIVGEAIKPFDREKLFLTTKISPRNLRYNDLIRSAKQSLKRLQVDYVDLYFIHWPSNIIPLKETVRGLDYLIEQDLTRFIGVSNFSAELMREAQSYTNNKIIANQVEYSLIHREPEKELLPYCIKNKIVLIAYRPLGKGQLAKTGIQILDQIAKKYKKTQAQVSLNWVISKKQVVAIPKASKIEHINDNAGAIGWKLKREDIEKLNIFAKKF